MLLPNTTVWNYSKEAQMKQAGEGQMSGTSHHSLVVFCLFRAWVGVGVGGGWRWGGRTSLDFAAAEAAWRVFKFMTSLFNLVIKMIRCFRDLRRWATPQAPPDTTLWCMAGGNDREMDKLRTQSRPCWRVMSNTYLGKVWERWSQWETEF